MPGMKRGPIRSRRLWSLSKDRLRYASDAGLAGLPFGVLFSATGGLCLSAIIWGDYPRPLPDFWNLVGGICLLVLIGGGHFAIGTALLWRSRVSLDRNAGIISTRRGWLGVVWHRFPLAQFRSISVRTAVARRWYLVHDNVREIMLIGDGCPPLVVGFATSDELATEIESEVRSFLGLTEIDSRRTNT